MKLALRSLLRNPAFAATAILSLALGIGANTAIFTLTNQILLRALPVKDPQRLVAFHWTGQFIGGSTRGYEDSFSYPMYADLRGSSATFTGIAARYQDTVDVSDKGPAERANAELVSGNYFDVLGVTPALGRLLTPNEDKLKGGEAYVVLSYDYWQRRFGGDPSALNRAIDVNGHPITVVGVAQRGFQGLSLMSPADLFVPLMMKTVVTPTWDDMGRRDSIWLHIFARLRPGTKPRAAQNAIAGLYRPALERDLSANGRSAKFSERYVKNQLRLVDGSQGFGGMREFFSKPLRTAGHGGNAPANRLRECGQPAHHPGARPAEGDLHPAGAGGLAKIPHAPCHDRESAHRGCHRWRSRSCCWQRPDCLRAAFTK
jgi:hypothetical protein